MKKKLIGIILILFLLLLSWRVILLVTGTDVKTKQFSKPPVAVEVEKISCSQMKDIREFTGTVYPLYQYILAPKVSGRIVEIKKRIGDTVRKGEIIAKIDDAEYQQSLLEAEANLKIAQASLAESQSQLELARQELGREKSLQEKGISSPSELDAASTNFTAQESRLKLAQAQVEQREASLKSAKIRLDYTVLTASESGYIGERFVDEGALLAPNSPVVSVIGINKVYVRSTITEKDYGFIRNGQESEIFVDTFPGKIFLGKVARIAPMLQETSRVANMEIEVPNDSLFLKPGMFARIKVVISEKDSVQNVPNQSVIDRNGENGVFTVAQGDSAARYFIVKTGIITPEKTEIISPKLTGFVVTLGQHLLNDGSPVILPDKGGEKTQDKKDKKQSPGKETQK